MQILRTNRGLAKFFFLSLITFNIYGIVVMSHISTEINQIASKNDGKNTMLAYFRNCSIDLVQQHIQQNR